MNHTGEDILNCVMIEPTVIGVAGDRVWGWVNTPSYKNENTSSRSTVLYHDTSHLNGCKLCGGYRHNACSSDGTRASRTLLLLLLLRHVPVLHFMESVELGNSQQQQPTPHDNSCILNSAVCCLL